MVQFNKLSDDVYASGQITGDDFGLIKDFGFKSIIINRPDGEAKGQALAQDTMGWAKDNGIEVIFLPMTPGQLTADLIGDFAQSLADLPKPILAHCASGTRSTILWAFANAKTLGVDEVMARAKTAGYNIGGVREALTQFAS